MKNATASVECQRRSPKEKQRLFRGLVRFQLLSWPKDQEMDSLILVNEAREAEFQMSKLDFINQEQSRDTVTAATASDSLSVRSSILYLLHCPNLGVPVFNWLCLSGLPQVIY